jgi:hypothetical protein
MNKRLIEIHSNVCNFMFIANSQFDMFINASEVNKIFHSIKFSSSTHILMRVAQLYLYLYCFSSYLSSLVQACECFPFLSTLLMRRSVAFMWFVPHCYD